MKKVRNSQTKIIARLRLCGLKIKGYNSLKYYEICSFYDQDKYFLDDWPLKLNLHHNRVMSRVYPTFHRVNSFNYDPVPYWLCGFQFVALNYQTPGSQNKSHNNCIIYIKE